MLTLSLMVVTGWKDGKPGRYQWKHSSGNDQSELTLLKILNSWSIFKVSKQNTELYVPKHSYRKSKLGVKKSADTVERQPLKANKEPYIQEHSFSLSTTHFFAESGGYSAWEGFLAQTLGLNKGAQRQT